jgi:prepilin-type N-terminal cleavage/methylation domain-containing protein
MTSPTTSCRRTADRAPAERRPAGFTLLELLLVMAIIGVLLGFGVGAFNKLAAVDRVAAGQIRDALRMARSLAVAEGAPASVVVEPAAGEVYGLGLRAAGNWHFEEGRGAGWPLEARLPPDVGVVEGLIGSGLQLGRDQPLSIVDLPSSFDSPDGFGIDVALRPDADPRPMRLLEREGAWGLRLDEDDHLEVTIHLDAKPSPEEFRLTTGARLPADRWSRVRVVFDGRTLHVAVDGARVGEDTLFSPARRMALGADPGVSTGRGGEGTTVPYRGGLDELRLASVVRGDHETIPPDVVLEGEPRVLHLDAGGRLDPAWHAAPVTISFRAGEPPVRTVIEYGLLGSVRSWTERP